jgi:hypothetical protein
MLHHDTMANPILTKLFTTLIDETSVNWTPHLSPLMFNYNTRLLAKQPAAPDHMAAPVFTINPSFQLKQTLYEQNLSTEVQGHFTTMQELMQCRPEVKPTSKIITSNPEITHRTANSLQ